MALPHSVNYHNQCFSHIRAGFQALTLRRSGVDVELIIPAGDGARRSQAAVGDSKNHAKTAFWSALKVHDICRRQVNASEIVGYPAQTGADRLS